MQVSVVTGHRVERYGWRGHKQRTISETATYEAWQVKAGWYDDYLARGEPGLYVTPDGRVSHSPTGEPQLDVQPDVWVAAMAEFLDRNARPR